MPLTLAALKTGSDPQGPLPPGAFHRTLEDQLTCPKCDVTYSLIADYAESTSRFFAESSRPLILMLKKAIFMGHANNHRTSHFETSGVTVREMVSGSVHPEESSPGQNGILQPK